MITVKLKSPLVRAVGFLSQLFLILSVAGCQTVGTVTPVITPTATVLSPQVSPTSHPVAPATLAPTVAPTETMGIPTEAPMSGHKPMDNPPVDEELLDPMSIPQFVEPLVIPPVMPSEGQKDWNEEGQVATEYWIAARQFQQQVLPTGLPMTTVWGYGHHGDPLPGEGLPTTFNFPAFTVEARTNERVRVVWVNQLVDDPTSAAPKFLPHILPVDPTLHWANPGRPPGQHDMDTTPYLGPVPLVPHVHGAHVGPESDGYPEAWFLPEASNIPENYVTLGPYYDSVHTAPAGAAIFEYPNDQRASTIWYHDHTLGITRLNVYAGLAGFWLIRDDIEDGLNLPGPAPRLGDAPDTRYYEIPIVIQDRTFKSDGSFFYPSSRSYFDGYTGPYVPETEVAPIWNPEFFGDTMVVNGRTWPYLEVEPRLYRFRFLNGANSRFMILKFDRALFFNQIGNEGGLLPDKPLVLDQLLMAPAERADVIVDFSAFKPGDTITLLNLGPDEPFGGLPVDPEAQANPETTGKVMQFRVVELTEQGNPGSIPETLPAIAPLTTDLPARTVTLNEKAMMPDDIPVEAQLGDGIMPQDWDDDITENPQVGDTEIWQIVNLTVDAHPIHLHLVHFQIVERIPFDKDAFMAAQAAFIAGGKQGDPPNAMDYVTGDPVAQNPWEAGWKETVIAYPDMITRIIATFDISGLYVWHCHILEHEDNEMMRPFYIRPD